MTARKARRGIGPCTTVPTEGRVSAFRPDGLGGDLLEPAARVGHAGGQRDGHQRGQVPARLITVPGRAQRDRHVDRHDEILDGFSAAA